MPESPPPSGPPALEHVALAMHFVQTLKDVHTFRKVTIDYERNVTFVEFGIRRSDTQDTSPVQVDFWTSAATGRPCANITVSSTTPHITVAINSVDDYVTKVLQPLQNPDKYGLAVRVTPTKRA